MIRLASLSLLLLGAAAQDPAARPNILWITCEDISPNVRCFGDPYAVTPNIDALAAQGVRYTNAFAPIGVCAPSRSTLIMGTFAPSVGSHHMRCKGDLPSYVKCFPEYLRDAGYYATNSEKTDYNFPVPKGAWDES
ncbi:MAG TPA: sulfatase-like hydrolase/transferase, partial [Planctomycetota bacterium]|nr:sulfatase-like hydrolase/transferase [Planctomycetota bacterium]